MSNGPAYYLSSTKLATNVCGTMDTFIEIILDHGHYVKTFQSFNFNYFNWNNFATCMHNGVHLISFILTHFSVEVGHFSWFSRWLNAICYCFIAMRYSNSCRTISKTRKLVSCCVADQNVFNTFDSFTVFRWLLFDIYSALKQKICPRGWNTGL